MAPSNATQTQRDERVVRDADDAQQRARFLKRAFCAWVILLALFQFSENTADPDLWGHVTFGQEMLSTHSIPRTEMYSWTAAGQPWFNHEVIAEISLGAAHALLGGAGLLLLKMTVGLLAFALALKIALEEMNPGERWVAWAVGAIAVVEISFGFSARPQIFTALCVVLELLLLRRIHAGAPLWAIALPPLFVFWINTHGGVLAGVGLLGVAAVASTAQHFFSSSSQFFHASELEPHLPPHPSPLPMGEGASPAAAVETDDHGTRPRWPNSSPSPWGEGQGEGDSGPSKPSQTLIFEKRENSKFLPIVALWLALAGAIGALFCNPWGAGLIRFIIESVSWLRPEIEEWNPTPLNWDHAAMFILVALAIFAWACTQRRRAWWEAAVCAAFAVLALRSVRNVPLFALVAMALVPRPLSDALARFRNHFARAEELWKQPAAQKIIAALLAVTCILMAIATFTLHKQNPFTMEVPRDKYPVAAIDFIREHGLRGKMFVYFDWGEMAIFHLPDCPPSIDGRLDTCYSRELIAAHWKVYNGELCDPKVFDPFAADMALLPAKLAGSLYVSKQPGWRAVYYDDTAVLFVRDATRFAGLQKLALPVEGPKSASIGRAAFADKSPRPRDLTADERMNECEIANRKSQIK